jgi:LacI family kdg operon repressor
MEDASKKKVTINDVATIAKVSKATISRYLNGQFEYMSEETKESIRKIIEKLDYRPSNIARSLKAKNSGVIGCIIADIASPFSSIVVKGINDICNQMGYSVLFANTDNNPEKEIKSIQSLMDNKVDGLIVNTSGEIDDYLLSLKNQGVKIVLADRGLKSTGLIDTVATNNYQATYDCIEYLYKQGYKKVAFFTQDTTSISSRYLRHDGYKDAMLEFFNIDGNQFTYLIEDNDLDKCEQDLLHFKQACNGEPGAIFTVNGVTLLNVLHGFNRLKIEISDKIGICGFDDWGWAALIPPGITTITQESYECGVQSVNLLIQRIKDPTESKPKYIELPAKLVKRGSTNPTIKKGGSKNEQTGSERTNEREINSRH